MSKNAIAVQQDSVVTSLQRASTALAEAKTIQQTKQILDVAAAAEIYAKRQQLGEENIAIAHSIKLEALRKLGEMLKASPKNEGQIRRGTKMEPRGNQPQTLAELGLDKKTSAVAQKLAELPQEAFEQVREGHETISKAIAAVNAEKSTPKAEKKAFPKPQTAPVAPEPEPENFAPEPEEIAESERFEAEQLEYIRNLLASDAPLAQALRDVKKFKAAARVAEERFVGVTNEKNVLIRQVKSLQAKLAKAGIK